jgi:hypothetical protein
VLAGRVRRFDAAVSDEPAAAELAGSAGAQVR